MLKTNKILNLRQQILAIAGSMVILRLGFTFILLRANMLNLASFVGLLILFVAAVGLMRGQLWAKHYYTFAAGVSIIGLLRSLPSFFVVELPFITKLVFIILLTGSAIWAVYVIIFLNTKDVFEEYKTMLESGANFDKAGKVNLENLVEEMLPIEYTRFNNIDYYQILIESIFDWLEVSDKIEKIYLDETYKTTIIIESAETKYEVEVYVNAQLFDNLFLGKVNTILRDFAEKDKFLGIIYPGTTLDLGERSLVYENALTFRKLQAAGFYKN